MTDSFDWLGEGYEETPDPLTEAVKSGNLEKFKEILSLKEYPVTELSWALLAALKIENTEISDFIANKINYNFHHFLWLSLTFTNDDVMLDRLLNLLEQRNVNLDYEDVLNLLENFQ